VFGVNISLFCNTEFIRDKIYWEGTFNIPRDWNSGLHEVLGLEPVKILIIFFWAKKTFLHSVEFPPKNYTIIYYRMKISKVYHFKHVHAANGVHGSNSITSPTQFWKYFYNMILPTYVVI